MSSLAGALGFAVVGLYVGGLLDHVAKRLGANDPVFPLMTVGSNRLGLSSRWALLPVIGPIVSFRRPCGPAAPVGLVLTQLITGPVFGLLWLSTESSVLLVLDTVAVCVLILLAHIDVRVMRIPNKALVPALAFALLVVPVRAWVANTRVPSSAAVDLRTSGLWLTGAPAASMSVLQQLGGGALALAIGGAVWLCTRRSNGEDGMGLGDVKLAAYCGLAVSFPGVLTMFGVTILLLGAAAAILVVQGRANRLDALPMAPFMAFGTFVAMLR